MQTQLPEFIQEILGNPRYKFAILIVLSLLAVFFIYGGDEELTSHLPDILATGSVIGAAVETASEPVDANVNIEMLAPF